MKKAVESLLAANEEKVLESSMHLVFVAVCL